MASIIRIKRSSGTNKPSSLNWGELAYVTGIGSYGGTNQYKDRIFLGDDGANVNPVGGYYYTSMMEHQPGAVAGVTNTRNQNGGIVVVLDSNRKVDQWNVDNLRLDGNTFSSQNTDGDIVLDPNGTGEINVVDDTYLSFGTDKDVKLRYDELTDNKFEIEGADWAFANGVAINIGDVTQSSDKDTGALVVEGGVGIEKNLNIGGNVTISGVSTFTGGIYYQTGDFSTHGVVYFDSTGLQTSTNDPASPTITSKQVLTAITEITLTFGSVASVTTGDIVLQDTSGAYGIVKTTVSSSTITLVGVEGTFTNTYNVNKNGVSLSLIPTTVTTIYTNKPSWTSTLDGGTF